jgi:aspartyl/glutamyl-tRNA(Asn/Gln) amidotransferase C subunit
MPISDDLRELCDLSKLEIPNELMIETGKKISEVLLLFDKLDEFDKANYKIDTNNDIKIEKPIDALRDDQAFNTNAVKRNLETKMKFSNSKNGYILGPRI